MRFARAHGLALGLRLLGIALTLATGARASPDPCATSASVSPCFDADPWWIPTGPTRFAGVPTAHTLPSGVLAWVLGLGVSTHPVTLVTPAPHPDGQKIGVVDLTSTLTLGARYGLGRGADLEAVVPFVPYQTGASTESVTSQAPTSLGAVALRDPRLGFAATLLGRSPSAPFSLGTHLALALPLGTPGALAGGPGPTLAPGFTGELALGRLDVALDLGARLVQAVSLGTVREGSSATLALGLSLAVLEKPLLAVGVEGVLRPSLVRPPAGAPSDVSNLPAEWLASLCLKPSSAWMLLLGAGSGLPLSTARTPDGPSERVLAVTSPELRGILTVRYTLPSLL
ncbi:MAG TPA: hypothetical protein VNN72_00230 [Polyangiaceae bacterium]|nr:hypothetical protein [Polyangiaceae bacterium]